MDSMDVGIRCLTTDNRGEAEQFGVGAGQA